MEDEKTINISMNEKEELTSDIKEGINGTILPTREFSERMVEAVGSISRVLPAYGMDALFTNPAIEVLKKEIQQSAVNQFKLQLSVSPAIEQLKRISFSLQGALADTMKMAMASSSVAIADALRTPMMEWLRSIDYSPVIEAIKRIGISSDDIQQYRKLEEIYLRAMYEAKWFPYAGWVAKTSLLQKVLGIIAGSRGASKNREKRIDREILGYYSEARIREIKKSWKRVNIDSYIRKAICQALNAYQRREYALTISCLSTMWEGLIYCKAKDVPLSERKRQSTAETKNEFEELVERNNYKEIFSDYYRSYIMRDCNSPSEVIQGVPGRHGVAHGWYLESPSKKSALNAILLTDFIIKLDPIEQEL